MGKKTEGAMSLEECGPHVNEMWHRIGSAAEARAYKVVEHDAASISNVYRWARFAEACFWQSCGEADCHDFAPSQKNVHL